MRHYSLIPVRYNDQQLLVPCAPIDAELWSIQWSLAARSPFPPQYCVEGSVKHWFADCAPLEYETASALVQWLNAREQIKAVPIREEST